LGTCHLNISRKFTIGNMSAISEFNRDRTIISCAGDNNLLSAAAINVK